MESSSSPAFQNRKRKRNFPRDLQIATKKGSSEVDRLQIFAGISDLEIHRNFRFVFLGKRISWINPGRGARSEIRKGESCKSRMISVARKKSLSRSGIRLGSFDLCSVKNGSTESETSNRAFSFLFRTIPHFAEDVSKRGQFQLVT